MEAYLIQRSASWYNYRRGKIGASEASALLGVSPWKTAYDVWLEKTSECIEVPTKNPYMQRGIDLEPEALRAFEAETGFLMTPTVLEHPKYNWMICSLDGLDIDLKNAVEIKAPGQKDHMEAIAGRIPEKYIPQLQHQIEVTGLDMIYYCSYRPENPVDPIVIIEVQRDDEYISKLIEVERRFYEEHMLTGIPPEKVERFKSIDSEVWRSLTDEYKRLDSQERQANKRKEEIRDYLVQIAQEENARGNGITLQKIEKKGIIDYKNIPVLKTMDLEPFRKPGTSYWQVKDSNDL